ncbi:MAG: FKBP-type peptidyl-prolyl cis-trans isomerase [Bacteroidales bacterium]|nr:FKBP-type peptidyl-prolyl cis-trans isomerase [Candidatus Equimonas faecalis]
MDKTSYALGMVIAHNLRGMGVETLATEDFAAAVQAVLGGQKTALTDTEAQITVQQYLQKKEEEQSKAQRAEGEKYLAENAKKEGVAVTASGLQYEILKAALGQKPVATDTVTCHYEGRLTDGTVFDSSYRRGEPASFPLQGVIAGWTEGLQLMAVGSKFRFTIPYQLGYGARGAGQSIPPYATLIFDVELLGIQ